MNALKLATAIFPAGSCISLSLPHDGSMLCYALALIRVLPFFIRLVREQGVRSKQLGLMQVYHPMTRSLTFICPLEERIDMLRFELDKTKII